MIFLLLHFLQELLAEDRLCIMASNDTSQFPRPSDSPSKQIQNPSATSSTEPPQPQTVRFASVDQEIEPAHSIQSFSTLPSQNSSSDPQFIYDAQEEIRKLSQSLQSSQLQQRRMSHYAFEPVSLQTSRVSAALSCRLSRICVLSGVFCTT